MNYGIETNPIDCWNVSILGLSHGKPNGFSIFIISLVSIHLAMKLFDLIFSVIIQWYRLRICGYGDVNNIICIVSKLHLQKLQNNHNTGYYYVWWQIKSTLIRNRSLAKVTSYKSSYLANADVWTRFQFMRNLFVNFFFSNRFLFCQTFTLNPFD